MNISQTINTWYTDNNAYWSYSHDIINLTVNSPSAGPKKGRIGGKGGPLGSETSQQVISVFLEFTMNMNLYLWSIYQGNLLHKVIYFLCVVWN